MSHITRIMTEISRLGVTYRAQALEPLGLKACHCSYLLTICDHPGISQDGLAGKICINKSNVARQVVILEEEGFVRRIPSWEDKRVMKLYPTEKTLAILPQLHDITDAWETRLTQDLTQEERAHMSCLLEKMLLRAQEKAE